MAQVIDYELTLRLTRQQDAYRVRLNKGTASDVPFLWTGEGHEDTLQKFASTDRAADSALEALGRSLYNALFTNEILAAYNEAVADPDRPMRLRLEIEPPELGTLPWETMHDGKDWVMRQMPIVRTVPTAARTERKPLPVNKTLKVLVVMYATGIPEGLIPDAKETMEKSLDAKIKAKTIQLTFLLEKEANLEKVIDTLRDGYHVLCFMTHSDTITNKNKVTLPAIVLHGKYDSDTNVPCDVITLATRVEGFHELRMVLLGACGGRGAQAENELSTAQRKVFASDLIQRTDIPAVIAMQSPVPPNATATLIANCLSELARFAPMDAALIEARRHTPGSTIRTALTPLLYLQASHGELFKRATNWRRRAFVIAVLLILLAFGIGAAGVFGVQRTQYNADIAVGDEREIRFQTLGHLTQVREIEMGAPPSQPLLVGQEIWVSAGIDSRGFVQRYDRLGKAVGAPIPTGIAPQRPFADDEYIWVLGKDTLTRIDRATGTPQTISVGGARSLFRAGPWLWVFSDVPARIMRIDRETLDPKTADLLADSHEPFQCADQLWTLRADEGRLYRINMDDPGTITRETLPLPAKDGACVDDIFWLKDDTGLYHLDPETLKIRGQVTTPYTHLDLPRLIDGALWTLSRTDNVILRLTPDGLRVEQTYSLSSGAQTFAIGTTRVWVFTETDQVLMLDRQTGALLSTLDLIGANTVTETQTDGDVLWLTITRQPAAVVGLRERDGALFRRLNICANPTSPIFDGTNLWVGCRQDGQLVRIPANIQTFGTVSIEDNNSAMPTVEYQGYLWFVQPNSGRILIYDPVTQRQVKQLNPGSLLKALIPDPPYLWAIVELSPDRKGSVFRLEGWHDWRGEYQVTSLEREVVGEIYDVKIAGSLVWIRHSNVLQQGLNSGPALTLLDRKTLNTVEEYYSGLTMSGFDIINDELWAGDVGLSNGTLYRFNALTGEPTGTYDPPDTTYSAWKTSFAGNRMWVMASAGLDGFMQVMSQQFNVEKAAPTSDDPVPGTPLLIPLDPNSGLWGTAIPVPGAKFPADVITDETTQTVWYSLSNLPSLVKKTEDNSETEIRVLDAAQGAFRPEVYRPCETALSVIYDAGAYMWLGCLAPDARFMVVDRQTFQVVHTYEAMGSHPWQPLVLEEENQVWFTFRDNDLAVVFDLKSGDVIQIYALSSKPMPPYFYDGAVWVYCAQDGVLQRIVLPQSTAVTTQRES